MEGSLYGQRKAAVLTDCRSDSSTTNHEKQLILKMCVIQDVCLFIVMKQDCTFLTAEATKAWETGCSAPSDIKVQNAKLHLLTYVCSCWNYLSGGLREGKNWPLLTHRWASKNIFPLNSFGFGLQYLASKMRHLRNNGVYIDSGITAARNGTVGVYQLLPHKCFSVFVFLPLFFTVSEHNSSTY